MLLDCSREPKHDTEDSDEYHVEENVAEVTPGRRVHIEDFVEP